MKRKRKIYLDTSVISHLEAPDVPEKMADTWRLWYLLEQGTEFEVISSTVTETEIADCHEPKRSKMVRWFSSINCEILPQSPESLVLAEEFVNYGVLSRKHNEDILHIAIAVTAGCDSIVSWNFKHFVNVNTIDKVNAVNLLNGYPAIKIVSPSMLMEKGADENE